MNRKSNKLTGQLRMEQLSQTLTRLRQTLDAMPAAERLAAMTEIQGIERELHDSGRFN